ncbi:MAG: hypothetical protein ACOY9C_13835 [Pseudomonadota bacterium]
MADVYVYAVSYDLGFAPNPFGGLCTLACCKPKIRQHAKRGDWVVGLTGTKLKPAMRCVFGMIVTGDMTFDEYWDHPELGTRRPKRNGTAKKLVGDNIYHRPTPEAPWIQEDSVHSLEDGSQCPLNTAHDTRINRVLLSDRFIYFGSLAPQVPPAVLIPLGYRKNARDYRRFEGNQGRPLIDWLEPQLAARPNTVLGDPINFDSSGMRFSSSLQRMV